MMSRIREGAVLDKIVRCIVDCSAKRAGVLRRIGQKKAEIWTSDICITYYS